MPFYYFCILNKRHQVYDAIHALLFKKKKTIYFIIGYVKNRCKEVSHVS